MTFDIPIDFMAVLLLSSLRVGVVVFLLPLLGGESAPAPLRILFALLLGMVMMPAPELLEMPSSSYGWLLLSGQELLIGLSMGLFTRLFLTVPVVAGDIVAQEMGLRMAQEMDPMTRIPSTGIGRLYETSLFLVFFSVDGHHDILRALRESFRTFPLAPVSLEAATNAYIHQFGQLMRLALVMAAPLFVVLLVGSLAMAILAKTVPQLNIMLFGFPLRILGALGLGALFFPQVLYPGLEVLNTMKRSLLWLAGG